MFIKRKINAFKIVAGRIGYNQILKDAVLDPKITIKNLNINGGYDWMDCKYQFIKLLITRGQILEITTYSDLLGRTDYLDAIGVGVLYSKSFQLNFKIGTGKGAFASAKRIENAKCRWVDFINSKNKTAV